MIKRGKKGQVWIETVIYTLIGLTIIGIVIAIVTPRIKQMTDRAIIEQTMSAMIDLHEKVIGTQIAAGNSRVVDLRIKKGEIVIDGIDDKIYYVMHETRLKYSEPGQEIPQGDLTILTEEKADGYNITLILDYDGELDITYNQDQTEKVFTSSPTSYRIKIENMGKTTGGKNNLNIISI